MLSDEELLDFQLDCYKQLIKDREREEFQQAIVENRKRFWEEQKNHGYIYAPYVPLMVTPVVADYSVDKKLLLKYANRKIDKSNYAKIVIGDSQLA
jgi:hypothetical protein